MWWLLVEIWTAAPSAPPASRVVPWGREGLPLSVWSSATGRWQRALGGILGRIRSGARARKELEGIG